MITLDPAAKIKGFVSPEKTQYHAEILANRLKARFRHLSRKFKKQQIDCFRLYDRDIPEVRAVVDWYAGHAVIAEYVRLQTTPDWLPKMADATASALNIPRANVHLKKRHTNTKSDDGPRYQRISSKGERFQVQERHLRFWVNLDDFLDTGLYSDHRDTRVLVGNLAKGKDFLNLYAYTGAFTCAAAVGGARSSVTVDRSDTYLAWAKDNLKLNSVWNPQQELIQSDVERFLDESKKRARRFALVFVDPPSFFQDRKSGVSFDIVRDHPTLLRKALGVTASGADLIFSTNHQRFEPCFEGLPIKDLRELTPKTIPEDYRNKEIHRCWQMTAI